MARLLRQGFVVIGRTNMVEFAFSGLGVNPHHGTPLSPWDRATGRLSGGSSSGAGVAAADHMGFGGLGTDTGGSCRVPAALCGVVGFKPTARRVPLEGVLPLAPSLDLGRAAGPQRRLLRPAGCGDQRRGAAAAAAASRRRRAQARPAARHLPDRGPGRDRRRRIPARAGAAFGGRGADRAVRHPGTGGAAGGERRRRLRRERGLGLAPQAGGRQGASLRPAHPGPHPAGSACRPPTTSTCWTTAPG
ncbi:amidase family protein [Dankookia sp. P2]|uniref:amidase family protein n=1 Tax=Dankookia sp. P2 TaxID=3423955 RepID=UPI003D669F59